MTRRFNGYNMATGAALSFVAFAFSHLPAYRSHLHNSEGWIDFSVGIRTEDRSVEQAIIFDHGRVQHLRTIPADVDVVLIPRDLATLKKMASEPPNEMLNMMLRNEIKTEGNLTWLQTFNYFTSLLIGRQQQKMLDKAHEKDLAERSNEYRVEDKSLCRQMQNRRSEHLTATADEDANVRFLADPYLPEYSLDDFPRLKTLHARHLSIRPEICAERPALLTEWFRENGFEEQNDGTPWIPELRQGQAFRHLMSHRAPIIATDQMLAGTTTAKADCGVIVYPDAQGAMIWGELNSVDKRHLNPYDISAETRETLAEVLPFWVHRNFREAVREKYDNPLCLQLDEHWLTYFCWKSVGLSHTVPNFPEVLAKGTLGVIDEIRERLADEKLEERQRASLEGMIFCLEGVNTYAAHLSEEAAVEAGNCSDPARRAELTRLSEVCSRVPMHPATNLYEAVQCVWTVWVAMHMENTNTGLSLGRLDQWLQPYFLMTMEGCTTDEERTAAVREALELTGCFMLRCTDHMPLSPDIGNYLFGGSPADQAITLGGITPDGEDGVNDMTYIFLKATELLALHDPNMNARIHPEKNSQTYIRRLCEVNYVTAATPSMHNDISVMRSLTQHGYPEEHARDWCAIGCVEQTISGRHIGHTGSVLLNLVAPLEMTLNNGTHPHMHWDVGPKTGRVEDFTTFDEFFDAYATQLTFIIDQATTLNNRYAEFHSSLRPTPLLSSLMDGCVEKARDVTSGGARYNTSGSSNIGLIDVTDSLLAVKKLVFDEHQVSFAELKAAIDTDFADNPRLHALVQHKVPLFGSGDAEAVEMANRVARLVHGIWSGHTNYRGGRYTSGFWSMSQHVAYGNLSGTLPSGRLRGKPFTPGLTPEPHASKNYLDFITDVARLDETCMDNNIAFNVKLTPGMSESRAETVEHMSSYVNTYCDQGGMQMQFNVVNSETLKDAMVHPEKYRNLLVRISGYNAYFVTLNKQQQIELIERAEYGV